MTCYFLDRIGESFLSSCWFQCRTYKLNSVLMISSSEICRQWLLCEEILSTDVKYWTTSNLRRECKHIFGIVLHRFFSMSFFNPFNGSYVTWKWRLGKWWLFCDYSFFLASFIVDRTRCKWTGWSAVEVNIIIENEIFAVVCSRCVKTLNLETSRCHLADYVKEFYKNACRACSMNIFPHSTNQIIVLWCCRPC